MCIRDRSYIVGADLEYNPIDVVPGATNVTDLPNGAQPVATPEACAELCTASPGCNGALWYGANPDWRLSYTCFLKTFSVPCMVPQEAVPTPNVFLLLDTSSLECAHPFLLLFCLTIDSLRCPGINTTERL